MFQKIQSHPKEKKQKPQNSVKDYVRTTDQQKFQLIDLVINEKYAMKLASEIVGVKLSTVKYIIKAYKTDKTNFMGKTRPKKPKLERESKEEESQNQQIQKSIPIEKTNLQKEKKIEEVQTPKTDFFMDSQFQQYMIPNYTVFSALDSNFSGWNLGIHYQGGLFY